MKGNKTALILMAVSMVLLTAFQGFWLRKEYLEQETNLYRQSDLLFKQTIRAMEDAMVRGKIDKAIEMDSPGPIPRIKKHGPGDPVMIMDDPEKKSPLKKRDAFLFKDSLNHRTIVLVRNDSTAKMRAAGFKGELGMLNPSPASVKNVVFKKRADSLSGFTMMVTMNTGPGFGKDTLDQLAKMMNPLRAAMIGKRFDAPGGVGVPENRMIYLDLTSDILSLDSLRVNFKKQLAKAGKPLKTIVKRDTNGIKISAVPGKVLISNTEGPGYHYTASFPESKAYLFSKIRTQILFSIVLLAITGLAFGSIYRSLRQQSHLSEIKNDLISNITHELKTPLSTVSVALEALQNFAGSNKPELTKEYLEISRNELDRLSLMVDNILKNSVLEHQEADLNREEVDMKEVISQLIKTWKPRVEKQGASLTFETEGSSFMVNADRVHLSSVIHNLIDNAMKYGGDPAAVYVLLKENIDTIEVEVEDNGTGIPGEYRKQVFEKFFRVPTGNKHTVKGYGLGLNYVWNIMKQHGGSVRLENTPGKGSVFIATLKKKEA